MVEYPARFLIWIGVLLFLLRLGGRRKIDSELRDLELPLLPNLNRLGGTNQTSLPVSNTVDHFLEHTTLSALAQLPGRLLNALIRKRSLDPFRLHGRLTTVVDGTGLLSFSQRHCEHCLTQQHEDKTIYFHPVVEIKLVTPNGLALSLASEFIENPAPLDQAAATPGPDYERIKQDCELKAFLRLAPQLKQAFPQLALLLSADSLYACGPYFECCRAHDWRFVVTFKEGRLPSLWQEFQALLQLQPEQRLQEQLPDKTTCLYRWVEHLSFVDSEGREHQLNALLCVETSPQGQQTTYAWLTDLPLNRDTVIAVARQGGRIRSKIENEGFNVQKNSGLNLEHAYSLDWNKAKAYYYLLQIGHALYQLIEKGSLLRALAQEYGKKTTVQLFGSQEEIAQRLLDVLRYFTLPDELFDPDLAPRYRISLNTS